MKAFFLTGSAALLLACGVTVFPAMAGGKIVNLTLRVLVDGPPPCSVKGSAVEFGNVIIKSIDGIKALMVPTTVSQWATP